MVRTRSGAAALIAAGHVRVNGERTRSQSRAVRAGDVLTVALDRTVRVLKVAAFAERRGSAEAACALFLDLTRGGNGTEDGGPATNRRVDDANGAA